MNRRNEQGGGRGFLSKAVTGVRRGLGLGLGWLGNKVSGLDKDERDEYHKRIDGVTQGVRIGYSPPVQQFLDQHGHEPVESLVVRRVPVGARVTALLNTVSLGGLQKGMQETGIDELFHLGLVVNGQTLLEKNEVVYAGPDKDQGKRGETRTADLRAQNLTINELLEAARAAMGDDAFFRYDGFSNNCQDFVCAVLRASGLLSEALQGFIKQDVQALLKRMPGWTSKLVRAATDLGALADRAVHG
jgi:hypothetical protein